MLCCQRNLSLFWYLQHLENRDVNDKLTDSDEDVVSISNCTVVAVVLGWTISQCINEIQLHV